MINTVRVSDRVFMLTIYGHLSSWISGFVFPFGDYCTGREGHCIGHASYFFLPLRF